MTMSLQFESFVLAASTTDLSEEPAARDRADAIEFRLDLADDPLDALGAYDGELPLIATNRAAWEGGEADDEAERFETLATALEFDAVAAVDLELAALAGTETEADQAAALDLRGAARAAGIAVIASTHDFASTPPIERLEALLEAASSEGDVGKLATTAASRSDALALLQATHRATEAGRTVATMGMGEAGRHTRAVAPVYGSRIGYAPVDPATATAPGQYDLATLDSLVSSLTGNQRRES
ncbi:type I 3-dehydroquinate dehydratase [Haloferacaceae archaeon DSL9]